MRDVDEAQMAATLDAIYEAAVTPAAWTGVIEQLGILFQSHFVDLFARTDDWSAMRGRAIGLDRADYEDEFLGVWCDRNIWSKTKPVRVAGEVLPTWQMVEHRHLVRSAIYNEYLHPRNLDEGMRLAIWAGNGWIMDISLLRSDTVGPFGAGDIAAGKLLLPHLQRAARVSRQLQATLGFASFQAAGRAAFLVDRDGRLVEMTAAADAELSRTAALKLVGGHLTARAEEDALRLSSAISAASRLGAPEGAELDLASGQSLAVLPVREEASWALPGPRAVLVVVNAAGAPLQPISAVLMDRFGLTRAEADFASTLAGGLSVSEIAASSGRSVNTVRTHLARVMAKTRTQRQSQLVPLLIHAGQTSPLA